MKEAIKAVAIMNYKDIEKHYRWLNSAGKKPRRDSLAHAINFRCDNPIEFMEMCQVLGINYADSNNRTIVKNNSSSNGRATH